MFTKIIKTFKVEVLLYVLTMSGYAIRRYLMENSGTHDEHEAAGKRTARFRLKEYFELMDKQICSHPFTPFHERIPIHLPGEMSLLMEYHDSLDLVIATASDLQIKLSLATMQQLLVALQKGLAIEQQNAFSNN